MLIYLDIIVCDEFSDDSEKVSYGLCRFVLKSDDLKKMSLTSRFFCFILF